MKLYGLKSTSEDGFDVSSVNATEVFTSMKRAARYGERQKRIHGWNYRIVPVYVNLIEAF